MKLSEINQSNYQPTGSSTPQPPKWGARRHVKSPPYGGFRGLIYSGDLGVKKLKKKLLLLLLFMILLAYPSCHPNRLKTSEKELTKLIRTQEKEKGEAQRNAMQKRSADTLSNLSHGFVHKEDRSVDPANPPVVLDFSDDIPVRQIKLSAIASKIRYIVLQVPDDSLYFSWGTSLHFTSENIVVNNNLGINLFSADGKFIETICKNHVTPEERIAGNFSRETFRGAWVNHVYTAGNSVYYKYTDYPGEQVWLFRFSPDNNLPLMVPANSSEIKPQNFAKGDIITSGKLVAEKEATGLESTNIFAISDNFYAGLPPNNLRAFGKNIPMLTIFNAKGDTLCKFRQYDNLETPVTSSLIRSFSNSSWSLGDVATFQGSFNDTIFRIYVPNRLKPAFVFNFGEHKITAEDWLHVNRSLSGRIGITDIIETSRYLFIDIRYYTTDKLKDARNEKVIYDKEKKELFKLAGKNGKVSTVNTPPPPPSSNISPPVTGSTGLLLENDLDGGLAFWPRYVTNDDKLVRVVRPEELISHIRNSDFKNHNNSRLADFVKSLKTGGREIVLMVVE
jgi:hypothetical protein